MKNTFTNIKQINLKDGRKFPAGSTCQLSFDGKTTLVQITIENDTFKVNCKSLPYYFTRFKLPSIRTLEKWTDEGMGKSLLGQTVELDGFDANGSPSWFLVFGLV